MVGSHVRMSTLGPVASIIIRATQTASLRVPHRNTLEA